MMETRPGGQLTATKLPSTPRQRSIVIVGGREDRTLGNLSGAEEIAKILYARRSTKRPPGTGRSAIVSCACVKKALREAMKNLSV